MCDHKITFLVRQGEGGELHKKLDFFMSHMALFVCLEYYTRFTAKGSTAHSPNFARLGGSPAKLYFLPGALPKNSDRKLQSE